MKSSQFEIHRTRLKGKDIYIYDARNRESKYQVSILSFLGESALLAIETIHTKNEMLKHKSFLSFDGMNYGIYDSGTKQIGRPRLTLFTEPIADHLHDEILRRKLKGIGFSFEERRAVFDCLYQLADHLNSSAKHTDYHINTNFKDYIGDILVMKGFAIRVLALNGYFSGNSILNGLQTLTKILCTRDEFTAFLDEDPELKLPYVYIISLMLILENCDKLQKEAIFTPEDYNKLIACYAGANIARKWQKLTEIYSTLHNSNNIINSVVEKISLDEMKTLAGANETNDAPIDIDAYKAFYENTNKACLFSSHRYFKTLNEVTNGLELSFLSKLRLFDAMHLQSVQISSSTVNKISFLTHLKHLSLISCNLGIEQLAILNQADYEHLEYLDLSNLLIDSNCTQNTFGSRGLIDILDSGNIFNNLKVLKLRACKLNTKAIVCLSESSRSNGLITLDIGYNYSDLTNAAFYAIRTSQQLKNLEELVLSGCRLGDIGLYYLLIATEAPSIQNIMDYQHQLQELHAITQRKIINFQMKMTQNLQVKQTTFQLKRLRIDVCSLGEFALSLVCCSRSFIELEELDLSYSDMQNVNCVMFELHPSVKSKLHCIKNLNFTSCGLKTETAGQLFQNLDGGQVECLSLQENDGLDLSILKRVSLPSLRYLNIQFMAKNAKNALTYCLANPQMLQIQSNFTELLTPYSIIESSNNISSLPKLKVCSIVGSNISQEIFNFLTNSSILRDCFWLDLSINNLNSRLFSVFQQNTLYVTSLKYLNLAGNKVTMSGLRAICKSTNLLSLQILDLSSCSLENKSLVLLAHSYLQQLEYLLLSENNFTMNGLKKHTKKLPKKLLYLDVFSESLSTSLADFSNLACCCQRFTRIKWFVPSNSDL